MQTLILSGASGLLEKYRREAELALRQLLPDTERLPERREEWDEFYEPDAYRDAPDFLHLADAQIITAGTGTPSGFWRGRLAGVTSFWTSDQNSHSGG